ncbi:hypothetical protein GCM10023231_40740 [Olivibacter ginsenosidimutans]|uniref:BD-FAE-like domain-containing protein n=1 Tax=Olivibacter ginsenosidimutans TaxID=1176537 RepID=A0ABP9CB33_9SPHI
MIYLNNNCRFVEKRLLFFCFTFSLFFSSLFTFAQQQKDYREITLWQKGLPNTNGTEEAPNEQKGIYQPTIRIYLPAKEQATGRAVIAFPGGGYHGLASDREGFDFAPYFNQQGIALIVLLYRMPFGHKEVPFSDAEESIRLVQEHAAEWNINPKDIGIMGSSAGGHLASTIATHTTEALRPAFQILLYPVITMDSTYAHKGSLHNLLGTNPSLDTIIRYSNEKQVTDVTPRAFIALSNDDTIVPPANGVNYYLALNRQHVSASLHIYPTGGHGWGIKKDFKYHQAFLLELQQWLTSF